MLASENSIAIVTVVWGAGLCIAVSLLAFTHLRLSLFHPRPPELKAASSRDRRKLSSWCFGGKSADVDPDLARVYANYIKSNTPLLRRFYRLFSLWGVFTVGLLLLVNPVTHPEAILLIVLALVFVFWSFRRSRRLERFVSRSTEAI